ncbi:vacuolar protein sorting-associated protein 33A isoform X1 [Cydia pomonella]|uniref:vacuolar protein sorting-associated protein 33A isoform X1 n=2 Tax=Cydia pomonella TaxID=82600 RepID=UPI002ADE2734|nr:vacuolar protein sorting-associated protein 33A isoform X1 [Cydia pomonella]
MKDTKMSSHLSGGRLNVALVQETMRKDLLNLLQMCEGPKITIWDEWLAGPVGLVAQYSLLKEHEVADMFLLKPGSLPTISVKHIVFIARAKLALMDLVADYINSLRSKQTHPVEFHLFFVPRRSELCEKHLANRGVLASLTIQEFKCDIFPFDSDVMSLELQNDFRENYLEGDPTCAYQSALALRTIQHLYGIIPRVFGKGVAAKQVWDLLCRLNKEEQDATKGATTSCIDQLLLLDRAVDFTSVMTTQLTYEGLIDELFGIKGSTATFPAHKFMSSEEASTTEIKAGEKKRIILNSGEELFAELRDCSFIAVGAAISKKARIIKNELDERHRHHEKSVQEIKHFVNRLPQMLATKQSVFTHTAIAECIKETTDSFEFQDTIRCEEDFLNCIENEKACPFIEDLIAQNAPLTKVLRLICLQCVTGSGLKPKVLEYYKRELVQVYGLMAWLTLCNLEKCGLLKPQSGARQYAVLRKTLHLTMDESELDSKDKSYLSSKYTPLTVRLSEHIAKNKGWTGIQDMLGLLPGATIDELQTLQPRSARRNSSSSETSSSLESPRVVLVFFIGGCTYHEISALRTISQMEDSNVEFVVLTTKLINGTTFIESLMEVE